MKHSKLLVLLIATLIPNASMAHHSLSAFNTETYQNIEGIVKEFTWINPHTTLVLMVEEPGQDASEWIFEGGSVSRLMRGGFTENVIAPGDEITVSYNAQQDGSIGGFFLAVTTSDGTLYSLPRFRRLYGQ